MHSATSRVLATGGGGVITVGLFVFMATLVRMPTMPAHAPTTVVDSFTPAPTQEIIVDPPKHTPTRQEDKKIPATGMSGAHRNDDDSNGHGDPLPPTSRAGPEIPQGGPDIEGPTSTIRTPVQSGESSRPATPIARLNPSYPPELAAQGVEGWVRVAFVINSRGEIENPHVIDSQPLRVFDRYALSAVRKWRYRPAMSNDLPVDGGEQEVTLSFKLEQ